MKLPFLPLLFVATLSAAQTDTVSTNLSGSSITEYFVDAEASPGQITHIFVFEGPRRIIGYKYGVGFRSVFDLGYVPMENTLPQQDCYETMFGVFRVTWYSEIHRGVIVCGDNIWQVCDRRIY